MSNKKKTIRDQINLNEIQERVPNKFLLSVAAAKRARQIDEGATPLIDANATTTRSLDIALLEIQLGKIIVSLEESKEEDSLIDDISDYLDPTTIDAI